MTFGLSKLSPTVDAALGQCIEAVFEPDLWDDALERLCEGLSLVGAGFHPRGVRSRLQLPATPRYRAMLADFIADGWVGQDLRAARGWPLVASGAVVVTEAQITSPEDRKRLPLYREFFEPRDMTIYAGVGFAVEGQLWAFSGARSARQGLPDSSQLALLRNTQPHLMRLVRLSSRLANRQSASALAALEAAGEAAAVLDWQGNFLNATGQFWSLVGDGIKVRHGRVTAQNAAADGALQALVAAALDRKAGWSASAAPVVVNRPDALPLVVEAIPARGALADGMGLSGVLLFLTDLEKRQARNEAVLRSAFGLTRRESEVASRLSAGLDLDEIAADLQLKPSSVQQLVKTLMAKLGASQRSELIALLSRFPRLRS